MHGVEHIDLVSLDSFHLKVQWSVRSRWCTSRSLIRRAWPVSTLASIIPPCALHGVKRVDLAPLDVMPDRAPGRRSLVKGRRRDRGRHPTARACRDQRALGLGHATVPWLRCYQHQRYQQVMHAVLRMSKGLVVPVVARGGRLFSFGFFVLRCASTVRGCCACVFASVRVCERACVFIVRCHAFCVVCL